MYELAQDKMVWSGTGKELAGDYCIFLFQSSNTRIGLCTVISATGQKGRTHWAKKDHVVSLNRLNICVKLDDLFKILDYNKDNNTLYGNTYKNITVPIPTMQTQAFNVSMITPTDKPKNEVKKVKKASVPAQLTALPPAQLTALAPAQLTALPPAQLTALAPAQLTALAPGVSIDTRIIPHDQDLLIQIIDNSMPDTAATSNLYFIGQNTGPNSENCYKIVITNTKLQIVLKELQAGNPNVLYVYRAHKCADYKNVERIINDTYGGRHIISGWFHINKKEIDDLIQVLAGV